MGKDLSKKKKNSEKFKTRCYRVNKAQKVLKELQDIPVAVLTG
jgi:hypothetical protein